MLFVSTVKINF